MGEYTGMDILLYFVILFGGVVIIASAGTKEKK